ncbi:redoxin domain-containing protein [Saliphagus sp. GCM10025334]
MVSIGGPAPRFRATIGTNEAEPLDLEQRLGDGPTVLVFFPGVFTSTCTREMVAFQERLDSFEDAGATIFGISADSPFSLAVFREELGLEFDLLSDMRREAIEAYDLEMDIPDLGLYGIPRRAVFVLDADGVVTDEWVAEDSGTEPDYDAVLSAVKAV